MEPIAIIGMAGRFPKAANLDQFWQNLCAGVEGIRFFSPSELIDSGLPADIVRRPEYVRAKGLLDDAELFDAAFFGYHPRDAEVIDPQQRLLLQCAWMALEDAGHVPERFPGAIGVFVGVSMNTYLSNNLLSNREVLSQVSGYQMMIGNDKDYAATRIAYLLNLTGPSIGVQTACSTSLVAVERACQSLVNQECDMALAGGASLSFPRKAGYLYQEGLILSPDGHCRVFDAQARGTVGGEGVGIVVLKRLSDSQRDGDNVQAIIRGWATNNDGSSKVGYTAPGVAGQAAVIAAAQSRAGVEARSITYIEAHGTGTELGDPVEVAALAEVFPSDEANRAYCRLGSVKSNIGHLDVAAGIAGLIKTVLALKARQIPPSLHFNEPNPQIDFARGPFRVNSELSDWQTDRLPRRAGISSFGIGGANAHLVLEEPPENEDYRTARSVQLLVLSAKSEAALDAATANLTTYLEEHPQASLPDVAYTLQAGRAAFGRRRVLSCHDRADALRVLHSGDRARMATAYEQVAGANVAFLFPGQGSQHSQMGWGIYRSEPCFRRHFDACAEKLQPILGVDLRELLYSEAGGDASLSRLENTSLAQPALFAVEYALVRQWEEWGVRPSCFIGHSVGEYVAACLADVFSLEDGLWLVAKRAELMQSAPAGCMLAVALAAEEVQRLLDGDLALAASNGPAQSVVSGSRDAIERLEQLLALRTVATRRLQTSHAFHSPLMASVCGRFRACVEQVMRRPPKIPFVSNVSGGWIEARQAVDPEYWVQHLLQTVQFGRGLSTLVNQTGRILLEVGPGQALSTLARQIALPAGQLLALSSLRHPEEQRSDLEAMVETLGRLWLAGVDVDWDGFHKHHRRKRVGLPTYPFESKRYCVEPQRSADAAVTADLPRRHPAEWYSAPVWKQVPPVAPVAANESDHAAQTWLLLLDNCGIGTAIGRRLQAAGQQILEVTLGIEFRQTGDNRWTLNSQRLGDYITLFDELRRRNALPDRIIHFWNVWKDDGLALGDCQDRSFFSLLYLAQVLGRQPSLTAIQIDVVSNRLHEVTGGEPVVAEKAALRGPLLVIPQEYPHLTLRSIDIELTSESQIDRLHRELLRAPTHIELVLRGRHTWTPSYEPLFVPAPDKPSPRLRDGGVYWIVGGLGQVGLALAEAIARSVRARLVLTSRRPLPPREAWEAWCAARDPDEPDVRKIRRILALEKLGAEVLITTGDLADESQMRQVLATIEDAFGGLHGMIHAAGLVEGRIIHYLSRVDCEAQFRAKVQGLYVLNRLIGARALDFCILTSSLSSVIGGMGFCAYTAANAVLDALAAGNNRQGKTPWLAINWDGWRPSERVEAGGSVARDALLLSSADGVDAFSRLLSIDWPDRVVVSTSSLQQRIDRWVRRQSLELQQSPALPEIEVHPRPTNLSVEYVAPRTDLERTIAEVWQQLLGIEQIGMHDNYIELGGHSLLAGQLIARLREILKIPLSIRNLFESPTIAQLAACATAQRFAMEANRAAVTDEPLEEIEI